MVLAYPQYPNGMYRLYKRDFDNIALMIMKEYLPDSVDKIGEVDIYYLIKECLFLNVRSKNIAADKSVLGLIAFEDAKVPCYDLSYRPIELDLNAGDILIDMSLSGNRNIPRRRFTLAHEASHWILHRSYHSPTNQKFEFRKPYLKTYGKDLERRFTGFKTENDEEEWQANSLAAALLMPKIPFIEYALNEIQRIFGEEADFLIDDQSEDYVIAVENIASMFNVSRQAAEIRLEQLGLLQVA